MDRSSKMALKSEEILTDNDIEGIFRFSESDTLTESNDLETELVGTFSKIQESHSESLFMKKMQKKHIKQKSN